MENMKFEELSQSDSEQESELHLEKAKEEEMSLLDRFRNAGGKTKTLMAGLLLMTAIGCQEGGPTNTNEEKEDSRPVPEADAEPPAGEKLPTGAQDDAYQYKKTSSFQGYGIKREQEKQELDQRPDRAKVVRVKKFEGYGVKTETGYNKYGEIVYRKTPYGEERLIND
jgi:hypothetical protein